MHRYYVGEDLLAHLGLGDEVALSRDVQHRIGTVLRMRAGEHVYLFGDGREFEAELLQSSGALGAALLAEMPSVPTPRDLTLYQALMRPNRFEWLLEKAAELGVTSIVPLISEHTSYRPADVGAGRFDRWRRILVEASEQCGRRVIPTLVPPEHFAAALDTSAGLRVFAWEGLRAATTEPIAALRGEREYSLFIGPEGGWSEQEVEAARAAGMQFLGLGSTILRAETAAIAAIALLLLGAG